MPGVSSRRESGLLDAAAAHRGDQCDKAGIFDRLSQNKEAIVNAVLSVIAAVPSEKEYDRELTRIEAEIKAIRAKKDRLLEMSIEGALSTAEFRQRNEGFNEQLRKLEDEREKRTWEKEQSRLSTAQLSDMKAALEEELSFQNGVNTALVASILDHIVVKKNSRKETLHLEIHLKFGSPYSGILEREKGSFCFTPS